LTLPAAAAYPRSFDGDDGEERHGRETRTRCCGERLLRVAVLNARRQLTSAAASRNGRLAEPHGECELTLLETFELRRHGDRVRLPLPAQRLLAYLALQDRALHRTYVAGALWLDSTDAHASGSVRSALWRLRRTGSDLVQERDHQLRISDAVSVDVRGAHEWAARVQDPASPVTAADIARAAGCAELLRDWYDDWVVLERERLRQLRASALEALCDRLTSAERFGDAIEVGLAAVRNEPLRESAHRAVIRTHLAQGNQADAFRHYAYYRRVAADALGIEPSARMDALVGRFDGSASRPRSASFREM
jgi:DNA-binding SARP family transcriptional activator